MKYTIPVFKALTERATLLGGPKEIVLLNAVLFGLCLILYG